MNAASILKREPALVHAAVLWLITNVGALVVEQWHWMGAQEWSSLTRALVPLVTFGIAGLAGLLLRRVVTPAWDWLEQHEPLIADAIEGASGIDVDKVLAEAAATFTAPTTSTADTTGA
ncbi:MAG TPA: hypothetical protein VFE40_09510 [Jatrophihabitantaceae bacterium]|nr:hypothetical protein [Jatrophihabitantaceae bacterium]